MNQSQAVGAVKALFEFFPNKPATSEVVDAWAAEIIVYDANDAFAAARVLGRGATFRPALADLLGAIRQQRLQRISGSGAHDPAPREYPHHIGVRAPTDDLLSQDAWDEAAAMRGKMVGKP